MLAEFHSQKTRLIDEAVNCQMSMPPLKLIELCFILLCKIPNEHFITEPTSVWLSMYRNLTGPVMDIFSPGFPYRTPRGPYSFTCSITPAE